MRTELESFTAGRKAVLWPFLLLCWVVKVKKGIIQKALHWFMLLSKLLYWLSYMYSQGEKHASLAVMSPHTFSALLHKTVELWLYHIVALSRWISFTMAVYHTLLCLAKYVWDCHNCIHYLVPGDKQTWNYLHIQLYNRMCARKGNLMEICV